ncbi:hypothetical protein JQ588_02840 [Bradyrhizobium liaoningense]|nr:hypothetical protein [Bradyrhizobium liaoningense]
MRGFNRLLRAVVEAIIESAKRAPSSMNTHPWHVRVLIGARIPEDEVIMTCVAMGYPDDDFAANAVRSDREHNQEFVRYVGFAD